MFQGISKQEILRSPNDQSFGVGPGMFKNSLESLTGFAIAVLGISIALASGAGYAIGTGSYTWAAGMSGCACLVATGIAVATFQVIKER